MKSHLYHFSNLKKNEKFSGEFKIPTLVLCASLCGAYLLGSVPFALLLGRLKGIDIRHVGSGNIGATNLTRTAGRHWGVLAFLLDFFKGLAPVLIIPLVHPFDVTTLLGLMKVHVQILAGMAAVLGHVWPIYLRFKGGKGVATTFGVMAGLLPIAALISGVAWGVTYLKSRFRLPGIHLGGNSVPHQRCGTLLGGALCRNSRLWKASQSWPLRSFSFATEPTFND